MTEVGDSCDMGTRKELLSELQNRGIQDHVKQKPSLPQTSVKEFIEPYASHMARSWDIQSKQAAAGPDGKDIHVCHSGADRTLLYNEFWEKRC